MNVCMCERKIDHIIKMICGPPKGQTLEVRYIVVVKYSWGQLEKKKSLKKPPGSG